MVPSVRELARELAINPNTIARAYRQLQDDGVLVSVRGTGLEVATGAGERCRNERLETHSRAAAASADRSQAKPARPAALRELVEKELRIIEKESIGG